MGCRVSVGVLAVHGVHIWCVCVCVCVQCSVRNLHSRNGCDIECLSGVDGQVQTSMLRQIHEAIAAFNLPSFLCDEKAERHIASTLAVVLCCTIASITLRASSFTKRLVSTHLFKIDSMHPCGSSGVVG